MLQEKIFDLFLGKRLHSIVGTISMYVPVTAILYPSSRNEILKEVLNEKWMCDIGIWFEKEEVKKDLIDKVDAIKKRALINGELIKKLLKLKEDKQ